MSTVRFLNSVFLTIGRASEELLPVAIPAVLKYQNVDPNYLYTTCAIAQAQTGFKFLTNFICNAAWTGMNRKQFLLVALALAGGGAGTVYSALNFGLDILNPEIAAILAVGLFKVGDIVTKAHVYQNEKSAHIVDNGESYLQLS